jgi:hypothetical protein
LEELVIQLNGLRAGLIGSDSDVDDSARPRDFSGRLAGGCIKTPDPISFMPDKNDPIAGIFLIRKRILHPALPSSPEGRDKGYGYQSEIGVYIHSSVPERKMTERVAFRDSSTLIMPTTTLQ